MGVDKFPPVILSGGKLVYFPPIFYMFFNMDTHASWENSLHKLSFDISYLDPHRVRVIVTYLGHELGVLYFEHAKKGYSNKPIGIGGWLCVDAKIEGLYEYGGDSITPKDIISHIQNLLKVSP